MSSPPSLGDIVHLSARHHMVDGNMCHFRKWLNEVDADLATEPARIADFYSAKPPATNP